MIAKHLDEARQAAIGAITDIVSREPAIQRAVLIEDIVGRLRLVVWIGNADANAYKELLDKALQEAAEQYWSGTIWFASAAGEAERLIYDKAWEEGQPISGTSDRVRITDRHRSRGAWFQLLPEPSWGVPEGPPILVFYSFKGGLGRSTSLASFAINRARKGERVVVVDFDLDSPGIGSLLAADEVGTTASWGVVDYLLECLHGEIGLDDYYHACRRQEVTGPGEILVFPAGKLNEHYLGKLARIDFEPALGDRSSPLLRLLERIRTEMDPDWLLIDARTGLSEPAGILLGGIAHLYVLFGSSSEQSWQGLRLVLERLGAERVRKNERQIECIIVQAMIPEDPPSAGRSKGAFTDRARDEFVEYYYAPDPEDPEEDSLWYVRDQENEDAPHFPVFLSYHVKLAHFEKIDDVVDTLVDDPEYRALADRIAARFIAGDGNYA